MTNRKTQLSLLLLPFVSFTTSVHSATELDTLVVTATRTPVTTEKLLSSVSVITREDIETYHYQTLAEALQSLPGVVIANSGGEGKQTSLFLRGTESNHTLILLNGVKLATNEFGAPQLEHIPLEQIERIELVRGPQSSLYGSESIGGTIQIFTKKGSSQLTPALSVSYGSHDTRQTAASLSGGNDRGWFNVGIGYKQTDGFDACDANYSFNCPVSGFFGDPTSNDKDGYLNRNSSVRAGYSFTEHTKIEAFSLYSEGDVHYDGFYNKTEFVQHTYGTNLTSDISEIWTIKTSLSQGKMKSDNFNNDASPSRFSFAHNKLTHFSLQNDLHLGTSHILTLGYDYEKNKIRESSGFTRNKRDNHAFFAQLLGEQDSYNYRFAIRNDDNEQFGKHTTGNIALGLRLNQQLRAYASYGTAFVAPSLIDLYSPFGSNANLKPERSRSFEFGLNGYHAGFSWSANVYQTKIKDMISLDSFFVPQNIAEARIRGLELQAATHLSGIDIDGQISLMDPEDKSGTANDGNVLARRAKRTLTFNISKSFGDFSLTSQIFASGKRFDNAANTTKVGGYTTVSLIAAYQLGKETQFQLKVANLFDKRYQTVTGYNADDRNVLFTINYRP